MTTKDERELMTAALQGYQAQQELLAIKITELQGRMQGSAPQVAATETAPATRTRRRLSPKARKAIAEAQRVRWEKYNAAKGKKAVSANRKRTNGKIRQVAAEQVA